MKQFVRLCQKLELTPLAESKVALLVDYFAAATPGDAAWALYFLTGRRIPRAVSPKQLKDWAAQAADIPHWLAKECFDTIGDPAEAAALLVPEPSGGVSENPSPSSQGPDTNPQHSPAPHDPHDTAGRSLKQMIEEKLLVLHKRDEQTTRAAVMQVWKETDVDQRRVWNRLIFGGVRANVSATLIARALAHVGGVSQAQVTHRLKTDWTPSAQGYRQVLHGHPGTGIGIGHNDPGRHYPFHLPNMLDSHLRQDLGHHQVTPSITSQATSGLFTKAHLAQVVLGPASLWTCVYKWDGVRIQAIKREGQTLLWSSDEEVVTGSFPEIVRFMTQLPEGTVIDGQIIACREGRSLGFNQLQKRLNIKHKEHCLWEEVPVLFVVDDLLESHGQDIRQWPTQKRKAELEALLKSHGEGHPVRANESWQLESWEACLEPLSRARKMGAMGVTLSRAGASYGQEHAGDDLWFWNADPYSIECVLLAAQPGQGANAGLFTHWTFGVWDGPELVPVAKVDISLTDQEILEVDKFIRAHATGKFGPVRTVEPVLVFELYFEGVLESVRHKSGVALRSPRVHRRVREKQAEQAGHLSELRLMI